MLVRSETLRCLQDGSLSLLDVNAASVCAELPAHQGSVWSVAPLSDASGFVSASADRCGLSDPRLQQSGFLIVSLLDIDASPRHAELPAHQGSVWSVAPLPDASGFVSASADRCSLSDP